MEFRIDESFAEARKALADIDAFLIEDHHKLRDAEDFGVRCLALAERAAEVMKTIPPREPDVEMFTVNVTVQDQKLKKATLWESLFRRAKRDVDGNFPISVSRTVQVRSPHPKWPGPNVPKQLQAKVEVDRVEEVKVRDNPEKFRYETRKVIETVAIPPQNFRQDPEYLKNLKEIYLRRKEEVNQDVRCIDDFLAVNQRDVTQMESVTATLHHDVERLTKFITDLPQPPNLADKIRQQEADIKKGHANAKAVLEQVKARGQELQELRARLLKDFPEMKL